MKKLLVRAACGLLLAFTLLFAGCGDIAAQLIDDEGETDTETEGEDGETAPVNTVPLALITGAEGIDTDAVRTGYRFADPERPWKKREFK
ncbi:MAG: hypothetical protein IJH59_01300, partial [Firmicutes bacterium]|nr:hypothetical protein [Bacillota bacterium]